MRLEDGLSGVVDTDHMSGDGSETCVVTAKSFPAAKPMTAVTADGRSTPG